MASRASSSVPPLRIAVVQFAPKIGQVESNIAKAKELCAKLKPRSVDLVCLPEMIFSGYAFPNAQSIRPYLEHPQQGPTSVFCSDLAASRQCYVTAGFPERLSPDEIEELPKTATIRLEHGKEVEREMVGSNSAVVYGPDGRQIGGYRKTNLFKTDLTWAKAGTGFLTFHLPPPLRTVTLAICNDLNPSNSISHLPKPLPTAEAPKLHNDESQSLALTIPLWTLKEGPYELADHCIAQQTNLLILLDAWLDSKEDEDDGKNREHDWYSINYWANRLSPLWVNEAVEGGFVEDGDLHQGGGEETIVVVCNRFGEENGEKFAGTSSLLSLRRGSGRPKLLEVMGRQEEGMRLWTIG